MNIFFYYTKGTGVCDGTVYCFRGFYQRYADNDLNLFNWWPWYFGRPWMSGVFSVMVVMLFNSGVLVLEIKTKSNSGIIGLSFLIGIGFYQVNKKIEETINTLFSSQKQTVAKILNEESKEKVENNNQNPMQM
ncbi:MAG: hypothetical protein Q8934_20835 [Bacillota bacterium]|nr:hypothetical protein [Bacillota bacterium]